MLPACPHVRLLGVAAALITLCDAVSLFAASLFVYAETGSPLAVSLLMGAVIAADFGGIAIGGALADRVPRKRLGVAATVVASVILALLVLGPNAIVLGVVIAAARLAGTPVRPAIDAALPSISGSVGLEAASGYVQALRNGANMVGPLVAGAGVVLIGAQGLFVGAAVAAATAACALACVRGDFGGVAPTQRRKERPAPAMDTSRSALDGARRIRRDPVLATMLAMSAASVVVLGFGPVADLPYATDDLGLGSTGLGIYSAVWAAGMAVGSVLCPWLVARVSIERLLPGALLLVALCIALLATVPSVPVAFLARFALGGIGGGIGQVAMAVLIARRTPDSLLGRVRATNDAALALATATSLLTGGFIVAALGARGAFALTAIGCAIAATCALAAFARHPRLAVATA
jgi:MFS family permease